MISKDLWHSFAPEKIMVMLGTDLAKGLTSKKVKTLQEKYGLNELKSEKSFYLLDGLLRQLRSPLSLVLLIAGVATIFLREYVDAIVIFIAVTINVSIGVLQEGKAAHVFEELEKTQDKNTTVIRDGKQQVVKADTLVPGDLVVLQGGNAIPADLRLIEVKNMTVNESSLTGEWLPVKKVSTTLGRALPITEQRNMAWMGTLVSSGGSIGVVVATGENARFGKIAKSTKEASISITPLQKSIRHIARFLIGIIAVSIIVILILGLIRGETLSEILLLAIAVAVAAMPEGLPAAVTVVLAIGMEAILRKGGLVKNLLAAETLGSTTIILTDKTGTLTQGKMLMNGLYTVQSLQNDDTSVFGDNKELLTMAILSSDAFVEEKNGKVIVQGRPIEKSVVEAGLEYGILQIDLFKNDCERLDFVQFEPSRRYAISLNKCEDKENKIYISGSPEHILARCNKYFLNGKEVVLDDKIRNKFTSLQNEISASGMRFIAVAYLKTKDTKISNSIKDDKEEFVFMGLLSFSDSIRPDVPLAIKEVQSAGVRVIMATGDYAETARAIAREVGIDTRIHAPVLTGVEISEMNDKELLKALMTFNIIARVIPEQKLRVAHLLKNNGEVVAMTGDGVNDAPALIAADIGIAVGSGTDVAKASADLILIDNSFSVITAAVAEGRRVVTNIRKIVSYLLSTSFTEIIIITGAFIIGTPIPLLPTQILWANIVGEGFMSFPFAFEPKEKEEMERRPEKRGVQNILTKEVRWLIFIVSAVTGAILFSLYFILLKLNMPIEEIRTIIFAGQSIASIFFVFSFKDLSKPIWHISLFSNKILLWALAFSFSLLLAALTLSPLQKLLSLTDISMVEVFLLALLAIINLITIEVTKMFLFKKIKKD